MKKVSLYLFALLAIVTFGTSCEKEDPIAPEPPQNTLADAFVGKWIDGNVNPAQFSTYDGVRQDDMENTMAYHFQKDGTAEQYIYYFEESENKQILTYRKGTVTFDAATKTLNFNPKEGWYRLFENETKVEEEDLSAEGLYPKYAPKYRDCTIEEYNGGTFLVGINNNNENVDFAKFNW